MEKGDADNNDDHNDNDQNEDGSPNYDPHVKTRPDTIRLELPVKAARSAAVAISNRCNNSLRGQTDILSELVQLGGADLKNFPCSIST